MAQAEQLAASYFDGGNFYGIMHFAKVGAEMSKWRKIALVSGRVRPPAQHAVSDRWRADGHRIAESRWQAAYLQADVRRESGAELSGIWKKL
jgi:hypothetical protein